MTLPLAGWFSIGLWATLFLAGLSLLLLRPGLSDRVHGIRPATRFFPCCSAPGHRLAFLHRRGWTSCSRLPGRARAIFGSRSAHWRRSFAAWRAIGWGKAHRFRRRRLPAQLDIDWQAYVDAFQGFYALDRRRPAPAHRFVVEQAKKNAITWLTVRKRIVEIPSSSPPPLKLAKTIPKTHFKYKWRWKTKYASSRKTRCHAIGTVFARWKAAKANLARWRQACSVISA